MLRSLVFATIGVCLLSGPASARGDGPSGGRRIDVKAAGGAQAERAFLVRRVTASRSASPVGGACVRARGGASRCRGAVQAVNWRWAQGLPPALNVQAQECPAGTIATLAEGHDDIVRCIPL